MATKAANFTDFIIKHNESTKDNSKHWTVKHETVNGRVTLTAENGNERIVLIWDGDSEVYNYPMSNFYRGEQEWAIRNVSEARKIVSGLTVKGSKTTGTRRQASPTRTVTKAAAEADDVKPPKKTRKATEDSEPAKPRLPFNLEMSDLEILAVLKNRYLYWKTGFAKKSGKALANQHLQIEVSPRTNRKLVKFADDEGFKSAYLDAIYEVK